MTESLSLCEAARERIETAALDFQARFYGVAAVRLPAPRNIGALTELAQVLTLLGRYEEGLQADRELTRLLPDDPTAHYNLACSLALLGQREEALDALEHAVELGYDDVEHLLADEDLKPLRDDPRFREVVELLGG